MKLIRHITVIRLSDIESTLYVSHASHIRLIRHLSFLQTAIHFICFKLESQEPKTAARTTLIIFILATSLFIMEIIEVVFIMNRIP
jgi:heme/copper-type cytochrome/quinol oxidase subunit 4